MTERWMIEYDTSSERPDLRFDDRLWARLRSGRKPVTLRRATSRASSRTMSATFAAALAATTLAALGTASEAQDATRSIVTTLDLKTCTVLRNTPDGRAWRCTGLPGYPVYVAVGDDRTFLSAGRNPERHRAAQQTLHAFNSLFSSEQPRAAIEWRVLDGGPPITADSKPRPGNNKTAAKTATPYAIIVRYHTSTDGMRGQIVAVSKVSPEQSCQMTLIDAIANPDAIERARRIADTKARDFDCNTAPEVDGPTTN